MIAGRTIVETPALMSPVSGMIFRADAAVRSKEHPALIGDDRPLPVDLPALVVLVQQ